MKATIYEGLEGARVVNVLPPAYRDLLPADLEPAAPYHVLLFAHTERDVVPSAAVRRALRRIGVAPDRAARVPIIAVGTVFTAEALELLAGQGARLVVQRPGRWTDQSARERQL